jgi:Cu2+-containing amine oxidase
MTLHDAAEKLRTTARGPQNPGAHPLAPLRADEIRTARAVLVEAGLWQDTTRMVYLGLEEPLKEWLYGSDLSDVDRVVRILLHDVVTPGGKDVLVSVASGTVLGVRELDPEKDGQLPVLDEEFGLVEEILSTDERWLAALDARGLDVANVRVAPCRRACSNTPRRRAGAFCAAWPSSRNTPATMPGPIPSTASSPTST